MTTIISSRPRNLLPTQSDILENPAGPSTLGLSTSESDYPVTRPSRTPSPSRGGPSSTPSPPRRPPSRTERRYICTFAGCDKAYFKPSRLAEHELTHTGERPHQCPYCPQSYLRSSHLHAHLRTHMSESDKPFSCTYPECDKRFWTNTHLKRHQAVHEQIPTYKCDQCSMAFIKSHMLRDHVVLVHLPPGIKAWRCEHPGCEASFALKQHLKTHQKTHDPHRYMCSHPDHPDDLPTFSTWSALQSHMHTAHPPKCPHRECNDRTFKSAQRLKEHVKVHEQRELDLETVVLDPDVPDSLLDGLQLGQRKRRRKSEAATSCPPTKLQRITSGEAGKEYECTEQHCEKRFKTKFALKSHMKAIHQGLKHKCPRSECGKAFTHRSSLQKHLANHDVPRTPRKTRISDIPDASDEFIGLKSNKLRYACPAHLVLPVLDSGMLGTTEMPARPRCLERYNRVYDIRRHLRSLHGLDLEDTEVRMLLARAMDEDKSAEV